MGGDEVIVVGGTERTAGREREIARAVLAHRSVRALEMVFVYPGGPDPVAGSPPLKLRMVDSTTGDYLAVCGGVTQVLGHLLSDRGHLDSLGLRLPAEGREYALHTGRYRIPIRLDRSDAGPVVHTCMAEVARDWLAASHFDLTVSGTPASFMGEFILVEESALSKTEAEARPVTCARLAEIHREVVRRTGSSPETYYAGTYRRVEGLHYRTRFVFWPAPRVEHFACGSGSTALALSLALGSPDLGRRRKLEYRFEVECEPRGSLGETRVRLQWSDAGLETASFSHDRVEILGGGTIRLDPLEIREDEKR